MRKLLYIVILLTIGGCSNNSKEQNNNDFIIRVNNVLGILEERVSNSEQINKQDRVTMNLFAEYEPNNENERLIFESILDVYTEYDLLFKTMDSSALENHQEKIHQIKINLNAMN